jgi:DNA-binding IclR family transcriptional regulator
MAQTSPGVHRMVAILNFLADHPDRGFTVSDLVRALKISRATCHTLLAGLVDEGYLYRAGDKSYVLGPTLAYVGQVAARHASPLQIAQPEMRALADDYDAICSALFEERGVAIVRDRAAALTHIGWSRAKGERIALRPPFGAAFFVRTPETELRAWIDRLSPPVREDHRAIFFATLGFVRDHGFSLSVRTAPFDELHLPTAQLLARDQADYPVAMATELAAERDYLPVSLLAPVFDARGRVAFALALNGFATALRGEEVARIGRRLREACDRIGSYIARRPPV